MRIHWSLHDDETCIEGSREGRVDEQEKFLLPISRTSDWSGLLTLLPHAAIRKEWNHHSNAPLAVMAFPILHH